MTNPFGAEAAELEQLHGQIREGEAAIRARKEALGDAYYRLHGKEESCELAEYCRQIRCREEDVNALKEMGMYGEIIGKAYYTGAVDLKEAISAAHKEND